MWGIRANQVTDVQTGKHEGARCAAPPHEPTGEPWVYGQEPETMSADGPAFMKIEVPTVDWMQ